MGNFPYSFANPDLMAYQSLTNERPDLKVAKSLGCGLQNAKDSKGQLLLALDKLLSSSKMIYYNLSKIRSILDYLNKNDTKTLALFTQKLKESKNFFNVLYKKLTSKEIGISRMIEYYDLYTKIVGKRSLAFEKSIQKKALTFLSRGDSSTNYDLLDFKTKLIIKLHLNKIVDDQFFLDLVPHLKSLRLLFIIESINPANLNYAISQKRLDKILKSKYFSDKEKIDYLTSLEEDSYLPSNKYYGLSTPIINFVKTYDYSSEVNTYNLLKFIGEYKEKGRVNA